MRPKDRELAKQLGRRLTQFSFRTRGLPGIASANRRAALVEQLIESRRRVEYVLVLRRRPISEMCTDPQNNCFDPIKAAIFHARNDETDEAYWLVFLFVHFGKHRRAGWRYVREIYGRLDDGGRWDWNRIAAGTDAFRDWLREHEQQIRRPGVPGGFGNHRKYESLDADSPNGTASVVQSYVEWVAPPRTHVQLVTQSLEKAGRDGAGAFDALYRSMRAVRRFGRTARFDYLTMVAKLGLAPIEPGIAYIAESTGPIKGARLLFGRANHAKLEGWVAELGKYLQLGMQVMEDALCNWQKNPDEFQPFRG